MKKILLVEDEKILVDIYKAKFSQAGFKTFLSFDIKSGLELAEKEKPDLILLDIIFPQGSGLLFLEEFKRRNKTKPWPLIIVFSNYDIPNLKKNVLKLGARDFILKTDYTPGEIVKKIKRYLR